MNLLVRINLALGTALAVAGIALGYACWSLLQANAAREVGREAGLMMDSALATRNYTSTEIFPLLVERMKSEFLPQTVPFYAATQNFLKLREQHPAYTYKEATLNPTNPRDRATDWEADIIQQFRNDPRMTELAGERDTAMGRAFYLARPIHADNECLECHGPASAAPASLLARYGSDNGFGWQPHEIVGAHVVSVPVASAASAAAGIFHNIVVAIVMTIVAILLVVNVIVYLLVVKPIRQIGRIAARLSVGEPAAEPFPAGGATELSQLSQAFQRLRTSLEKALRLLES